MSTRTPPSQIPDKDISSSKHIRSLEERLRASFALGDASEQTTPDASKLPSPGEIEPASVALPLSPGPELLPPPTEEAFDPLGVQLSPSLSQTFRSPPVLATEMEQLSVESSIQDLVSDTKSPHPASLPQSPAPSFPPVEPPPQIVSPPPEPPKAANPPSGTLDEDLPNGAAFAAPTPNQRLVDLSILREDSRPSTPRPLSPLLHEDQEQDVEKVRERLKLVEQRFSGKCCLQYTIYC